MAGLVWFDKTVQACQGPTSFIAYERGLVIFEYSQVFRSGGSLMAFIFSYGQKNVMHQIHGIQSFIFGGQI
jgi:hypothetical protein